MTTMATAAPQGYGNDLANWANQTTKIVMRHKLNSKLTLDGSLRIYWGFPGKKSYDDYMRTTTGFLRPSVDEDWEAAYRGNYYLNLGIELKHNEHLTFRMDGYNLLGIFDKDLNKRNYMTEKGDYRCHSVGIGFWAIYKFK